MGQQIEVTSTVVGDSAIFDTDRSITGQDGVEFRSRDEAASAEGFANELAQRLMEAQVDLSSIFIASNVVTATRPGGWDAAMLEGVRAVIADFFLFYDPAAG